MKFRVLTIFPELIEEYARWGLLSKAQESGLLSVEPRQLRDHAVNAQGQVDDMPYGGGSGMLLRVDTAAAAVREAKAELPKAKVVTFSPRGRKLDAAFAKELSEEDSLILLPYRYEGHDQRIVDAFVDHEVSLGDFVLMGGEVASMALIEASARFIPGVLGNPESAEDESF
ncbi:UNVERIFIED_CONTAM: hypothetical protein GTU68_045610, partial [Idotea baltica]|nr:hypothetical protein [Idotea baltica]